MQITNYRGNHHEKRTYHARKEERDKYYRKDVSQCLHIRNQL